MERCRFEFFRGDLVEWGRRYHHDGFGRNAAGDAGFESVTVEGFTFIAFKFPARKRERKEDGCGYQLAASMTHPPIPSDL